MAEKKFVITQDFDFWIFVYYESTNNSVVSLKLSFKSLMFQISNSAVMKVLYKRTGTPI